MADQNIDPNTGLANAELPEGFIEVTSGVDGYFVKEPGNQLTGTLLLIREYRDKTGEDRREYHVRLTESGTICSVRVDGEWEQQCLEAGAIIGVDCVANLNCLAPYADGKHEVYIFVKGKVSMPGGKNPWQFVKGVKKLEVADEQPF